MTDLTQQALRIMRDTFGYEAFRSFQKDAITSLLNRRDTLAVMPTGSGKSLCYQVPALIFDGLTVVVSPLIALMKDQVDQMTEYGVAAVMLNSSLSFDAYSGNIEMIRTGAAKLLYVAPETLLKPDIIQLLRSVRVECIAVDEAHCISEWGHDFRPEYRLLQGLREYFPKSVWLGLTATATERVRQDIIRNLGFVDPVIHVASFNRENLFFEVLPKGNSFKQVLGFIKKFPSQSGIIYCLSRKSVDSISQRLAEYGYSVVPYHAGLSDDERKRNQELFIRDEVPIIVATIAFGMGVHKSNIRFVVHVDLPKSIESYYQETGRAGRDGLPAHCLLLFSLSDTFRINYFLDQKPDEAERRIARQHLSAMIGYAESAMCRRIPLLNHFGENHRRENCGACDRCTTAVTAADDITREAQMFLSCVKRADERFGINHIIDVLRGMKNKKIMGFGHQNLSTYGIGAAHSHECWQGIARQLLQRGLMMQDLEQYGVIKITPRGYDVLRGKEAVPGSLHAEQPDAPVTAGKGGGYDQALFDVLRAKRKELAIAAQVPPYVIFSDKTLAEMATLFPQQKAAMIEVNGMGAVKFEKYGEVFLGLIRDYCSEHGIAEKVKPLSPGRGNGNERVYKFTIVGDAYAAGASIAELMATHEVKLATIIKHLYDYISHGQTVRMDGLEEYLTLSDDLRDRVFAAFDQLGVQELRPIFNACGEAVDFDLLQVYRVYYVITAGKDDANEKS